jgi:hypothetical protein
MKRQARPFVVETKRSRKAPTNLWASTPLLQQELAAAEPEPTAKSVFAEKGADKFGGQRPAEPARRILQSLVAEMPSPVLAALESEEAEEAEAARRRTRTEDDDAAPAPARRGRPRRVTTVESAAVAVPTEMTVVPVRTRKAAAEKAPKAKPADTRPAARASVPPVTVEAAAPPVRSAAATAADGAAAVRAPRGRAARNPAASALLLPGERWKRRLPQRLW